MLRDPFGADTPEVSPVLRALDDTDCREIVRAMDEPKTAGELAEECELPMSTTYRKLDILTEASLLSAGTDIRPDGHHTKRYTVDFESVSFELEPDRRLDVAIARPQRDPEARLANIWQEVRQET